MITAIIVGVVIGLLTVGVLGLSTGRWGRERLPWWFVEHAPSTSTGLLGVIGSVVVARIVHQDSWSLFFLQLAATVATMVAVGWPLRHRLRAADHEFHPFSTPSPPAG